MARRIIASCSVLLLVGLAALPLGGVRCEGHKNRHAHACCAGTKADMQPGIEVRTADLQRWTAPCCTQLGNAQAFEAMREPPQPEVSAPLAIRIAMECPLEQPRSDASGMGIGPTRGCSGRTLLTQKHVLQI